MENFYLYNFSCSKNELSRMNNVFLIDGTNLVAVDILVYHNKSKRLELSQSAKLLPFWITQNLFLDIIEKSNEFELYLTKIDFYYEIDEEFMEMIDTLILHKEYKKLRKLVEDIKISFDSNIKSISLDYKCKLIEISNRGAISIDPLIRESFLNEIFKGFLFNMNGEVNS